MLLGRPLKTQKNPEQESCFIDWRMFTKEKGKEILDVFSENLASINN